MNSWERLLRDLRIRSPATMPVYFPGDLLLALHLQAEQEQRSEGELVEELLSDMLAARQMVDERILTWESLTRRQQEIVAMLCLNYTNSKIARHLGISTNVVKRLVRRVLDRFAAPDRIGLRQELASWDFSAWPGSSTPNIPEINLEDKPPP
jgi:DNA-binding CsgD family transcriptional regulator